MKVRATRTGLLDNSIVKEGTELDVKADQIAVSWMEPLDDEAKEAYELAEEAREVKLRDAKIEHLTSQIKFLNAQLELELAKKQPKTSTSRQRKKAEPEEDVL